MKISIKRKLVGMAQHVTIFMWLSAILLTSSCNGGLEPNVPNNNNVPNIQLHQGAPNNLAASELIVFCGNPGVGKSSLCNSIFQAPVFKSGISVGQGMTIEKQEYIFENKKYIDTPGLADVKHRKQAAEEIEKALKENNNYKIVFVATLQSGRIFEQDLVTINTVCDAIKTPFEYGIIFNKVTNPVIKAVKEKGLEPYLNTLHKQPSSTIIIKFEGDMHDAENEHLSCNSENRINLVNFVGSLQANMIPSNKVENIDVVAYEEKVREVETKLQEALKQIEEQKVRDEALKRQLEQQKQEVERQRLEQIRRDQELKRQLEQQKQEAERQRLAYEADKKRRDEENRRLIEQQRQEAERQRLAYEAEQRKRDEELKRQLEQQKQEAERQRIAYEAEQRRRDEEYRRLIEQQRQEAIQKNRLKTIQIHKTCKGDSRWNGTSTIIIKGNDIRNILQRNDDPYIKEVKLNGDNLTMVLWGSGVLNTSIIINLNQAKHHFNLQADLLDIYVK